MNLKNIIKKFFPFAIVRREKLEEIITGLESVKEDLESHQKYYKYLLRNFHEVQKNYLNASGEVVLLKKERQRLLSELWTANTYYNKVRPYEELTEIFKDVLLKWTPYNVKDINEPLYKAIIEAMATVDQSRKTKRK